MSKHIFWPSLITLFKAKQAVQMYFCQWFKVNSQFKFADNAVVVSRADKSQTSKREIHFLLSQIHQSM